MILLASVGFIALAMSLISRQLEISPPPFLSLTFAVLQPNFQLLFYEKNGITFRKEIFYTINVNSDTKHYKMLK